MLRHRGRPADNTSGRFLSSLRCGSLYTPSRADLAQRLSEPTPVFEGRQGFSLQCPLVAAWPTPRRGVRWLGRLPSRRPVVRVRSPASRKMNRKGFSLLDLRPWIRPRCDQCLASRGDRVVGSGDAESAMNPGGGGQGHALVAAEGPSGDELGGTNLGAKWVSKVVSPGPSPRSVAQIRRQVPSPSSVLSGALTPSRGRARRSAALTRRRCARSSPAPAAGVRHSDDCLVRGGACSRSRDRTTTEVPVHGLMGSMLPPPWVLPRGA